MDNQTEIHRSAQIIPMIRSGELTMSSREIAELVNSRHDDVKRSIARLVERGVIQLPPMADVKNHLGQTVQEYRVGKRDSYVIVAQLSPEFTARLVDRWQELEEANSTAPIPTSMIEALRLAADQMERAEIAERTKAEIGTRREATAMNTASQAVKKANKLAKELDRSKEYATVKRMSMLYHGQDFNWRELKSAGKEMGIEPIDVFDANYGTVKAYHVDVWRDVYALGIPD